jgi:flavin-binding protein dodecin
VKLPKPCAISARSTCQEFNAAVENDKVTGYPVNAKVTFEMERSDGGK